MRRLALAGLLAVVAAIATTAGLAALASSSSASQSSSPTDVAAPPLSGEGGRDTRADSGRVGDGVTVFDEGVAALDNLDPELLAALRLAAADAGSDGITFVVNSGWRSPEYQDALLREAIDEYGSAEEAARWVATPTTSPHVSGDAVDLGPLDATLWLSEHGAAYGLCQIYDNEPWHYELRPETVEYGCPATFADPTEDPRMQQ